MAFIDRTTDEIRARITQAIRDADEAFWASVVKSFPEAEYGDFQGSTDESMREWMEEWVMLNVPGADQEAA